MFYRKESPFPTPPEAVVPWANSNGLGLTKPVVPSIIDYYGRNYRGLDAEPFAQALEEALKNGLLQRYDARILSAGFLADDSNFYGGARTLALIRDAARNNLRD